MKKKIVKPLLLISAINIILFSALASSAIEYSETPDSVQKNAELIELQVESSYKTALEPPIYKNEVYLNEEHITPFYGAESSSNNVQASSVTALSSPPVYSISLDGAYGDSLTDLVPEKWYVFSVTTPTKITTLLQHQAPTNSNIDIELYRQPTGDPSYSFVAGSYMSGAIDEQLSEIAVPGNYLLMIQAVGPVVGGSFAFGNFGSTGADANEPDDNIWQAQLRPANQGVNGNLDSGIDKDFHAIQLPTSQLLNYRITGGDYVAELFDATGASLGTIPNNTIARVTYSPGTYFWGITSPSNTAGPSVPYTFSAYRNIHSITFNFNSDEGVVGRVNWGAGNHFGFRNTAGITGYAYDVNNEPVAGATIRFTLPGSVGSSQTVTTARTNASGYYSATISSPLGAGSNLFGGACLQYHYDVHTLSVQNDFGGTTENISLIRLNDRGNEVNVTNSSVTLNDVAYYIYVGC